MHFSEPAGNKNLQTDEDEDSTAEDTCLACEFRTSLFADGQTSEADKESNHTNQHTNQNPFHIPPSRFAI